MLAAVAEHRPDVAIVDIRMPPTHTDEGLRALSRVASGGTTLDPEVVSSLMHGQRAGLAALTPRERQVLSLMAEGRSNAGIAAALVLTEGSVEKHIASVFAKLALDAVPADNRRVLAVLRYLNP